MIKVELLDLVDEQDNLIRTLSRDEIYAHNLQYVRVIEVFIRNEKGQLWIPIRNRNKRIAPGGFDVGVGGHVEHGETYDEAFAKEVFEEIGWNIDKLTWSYKGKFYPTDGLNTVSVVYEIQSNIAPELNKEDFVTARWLTPEEIVEKIKKGHPAKSNLLPLLRLVYDVG